MHGGTGVSLRVSIGACAAALFVVDGLLLGMHLFGTWLRFYGDSVLGRSFAGHDLFDVNAEISVPTWWQQMLLGIAGLLALCIAGILRERQTGPFRHWVALGLIFLLASLDEGASVHERLTEPIRTALGIGGGVLWYAWVLPGVLVLALMSLTLGRVLRRLPAAVRTLLGVGGATFAAGAIGVEMVGGAHESSRGQDVTYSLLTAVEEGLEMLGATFILLGMLRMLHLASPSGALSIQVEDSRSVGADR